MEKLKKLAVRFSSERDRDACITEVDLVIGFESLGENVELGCVQRACGAEPLGIFRFNTCSIANLCDALETRLEHLYVGKDMEAYMDLGDGRFFCRSQHYKDFVYHTLVSSSHMSADEITRRERKKTAYLRRRFLEELSSGEKIFVRKGCDSMHDLRRLHKALRSYGSRVLLVVSVADADHPAGSVEQLDDGMLRGYVSEFKVCSRPEPIDLANWLTVLRTAHRLTKPKADYARPKQVEAGATWDFADNQSIETCTPVGKIAPSPTYRMTRSWSETSIEVLASREISTASLQPGTMIVFSAWVKVQSWFNGRGVWLAIPDVAPKHVHPSDARRLGQWQRIWVTARVPRDAPSLTVTLCGDDAAGTVIDVGGWVCEQASVPSRPKASMSERLIGWRSRTTRAKLMRRVRASWQVTENATPTSLHDKATALIAQGAFVEADDILSDALSKFPSDKARAKLYAMSAHNSGRYAGAIPRWHYALAVNEEDPMCHAGVAANYREHSSFEAATNVIGSALAKFPDDMVVLTEAARIAEATHRWTEALPLWERAIAVHGPHPTLTAARDRVRDVIGV